MFKLKIEASHTATHTHTQPTHSISTTRAYAHTGLCPPVPQGSACGRAPHANSATVLADYEDVSVVRTPRAVSSMGVGLPSESTYTCTKVPTAASGPTSLSAAIGKSPISY